MSYSPAMRSFSRGDPAPNGKAVLGVKPSNVPPHSTPEIYFRKDPWVQAITNGKFNEYSFMIFEESDYMYHFAVQYIPDYLQSFSEKPDPNWEEIEEAGAAPYSYSAEFKGFGYSYYKDEEEKEEEVVNEENLSPEEKLIRRNKAKKKKDLTKMKAYLGEFVLDFDYVDEDVPVAEGQEAVKQKIKIYGLHKELGFAPNNGRLGRMLVFFVKGRNQRKILSAFAEFLAGKNKEEAVTQEYIMVYRYNIQSSYWQSAYNARSRPPQSVVLPKSIKKRLLEDVKDFLDKDTKKWYFEKGIPYKRSYLFFGVPGSGKTSIISVLAGEYKKPVCYLSPTDPQMTDEKLKNAIITAPEGGIIIFEDVDGLFTKDRKSTVSNHLTFSGLLNALDGVGSGFGQIFILTTNFRDRLDSALIRNGRVDLQVEFKHVVPEQVEEMFGLFYEDADEAAKRHFSERVFELIDTVSKEPCLSAAMLQNFFIMHRRCTYDQAIDQVEDLVEDVKNALSDQARKDQDKAEMAAKMAEMAKKGKKPEAASGEPSDEEANPEAAGLNDRLEGMSPEEMMMLANMFNAMGGPGGFPGEGF